MSLVTAPRIGRRVGAATAALFLAGTGTLLWVSAADAASAATTVAITYAPSATGATVTPSNAVVTAGTAVVFTDGDTTAALTVTVDGKTVATAQPGKTSAPVIFTASKTYTASSPVTVLGLPLSSRTVQGTVTVRAASASPTTGSGGGSTGGSNGGGVTAPTTAAGGGSRSTPAPARSTTAAAPTTAPTTAPTAATTAPFAFAPGLPHEQFGNLAPQAGGSSGALPPVVAPYATGTSNGVPYTLYTTYTPTPSPVAAVSAGGSNGGGGGHGRTIGLVGAITAVLLAGMVAAYVRLIVTHPAGRLTPRRH